MDCCLTHPGEDEIVLAAHNLMAKRIPNLRLVLVPRHPVRADEVAGMVRKHGLSVVYQSEAAIAGAHARETADVLLGDVMGSLLNLYGLAQVAYVGGSWWM